MPKTFSPRPVRAIRQSTEAIKNLEALVTSSQSGNIAARDKVILAFLPWIEDQARLYAHRAGRLDLIEDLRQTAICGEGKTLGGLMRAIETYDSNKGSAFHSFAIFHINAAFQAMLANAAPGNSILLFKEAERIRTIAHDLRVAFDREPSIADIRKAAGSFIKSYDDERIEDILTNSEHHSPNQTPATNCEAYDMKVAPAVQEGAVDARRKIAAMEDFLLQIATEQERIIYSEHVLKGVLQKDLAKRLGLHPSSVKRIATDMKKRMKKQRPLSTKSML